MKNFQIQDKKNFNKNRKCKNIIRRIHKNIQFKNYKYENDIYKKKFFYVLKKLFIYI